MIEKILFMFGYIKKPKFRLGGNVMVIDAFPPLKYKILNIYCYPYAFLIKDPVYSYELFREGFKMKVKENELERVNHGT